MNPDKLAVNDDDAEAPVSLAEKAYQILIRKITRLELAPGQALVEKSLTDELGIGRTPIREALQRIAVEGLIQHLPNRGMLISDISATSVQAIYEFRSLVEGEAARLAAARSTESHVIELQSLADQLDHATNKGRIDDFVALDRQFHGKLAQASRNIYLEEAVPRIFNLHLRLWFYISSKSGGWHPVAHSHDEMTQSVVEAIRTNKPDMAQAVMHSYIGQRHLEIKALL